MEAPVVDAEAETPDRKSASLPYAAATALLGSDAYADAPPLFDASGKIGEHYHLRAHHCVAALRGLPRRVMDAAIARIGVVKRCDLEDAASATAQGVLIIRGALSSTIQELAAAHWAQYLSGNATGRATRGQYAGRSIWRGGGVPLNTRVAERVQQLLADLHEQQAIPPAWPRLSSPAFTDAAASKSNAPLLHDSVEFIQIEPEKHMKWYKGSSQWPSEFCDWHTDGGVRGYKVWSILKRAKQFQQHTAEGQSMRWDGTGIDPSSSTDNYTSIVVAPSHNLCDPAQSNAWRTAACPPLPSLAQSCAVLIPQRVAASLGAGGRSATLLSS